jgi:CDP-diacylglycerol---glycerol-3-phosphate 3-phosphatidyltransferase
MNLPNKLTLLRILIIPFFLLCVQFEFYFPEDYYINATTKLLGLILFIVATITDYYDGKIARERNMETTFGKIMDPLADKLMVATALIAFVGLRLVPHWMAVIIIGREFAVTGLRIVAALEGVALAAAPLGKHKTGWQMGAIITILSFQVIKFFILGQDYWDSVVLGISINDWVLWITWVVMFVAVFLSVYSGYIYFRNNWEMIRRSK